MFTLLCFVILLLDLWLLADGAVTPEQLIFSSLFVLIYLNYKDSNKDKGAFQK